MVGLTAALACADAGMQVALVDKTPPQAFANIVDAQFDGRVSAIALATAQFFDRLGVWHAMAVDAAPIDDIRITDGTVSGGPSSLFLHYNSRDAAKNDATAEPMGYIVENRQLRKALWHSVSQHHNITLHAGQAITTLQQGSGKISVQQEDGTRLHAHLLVAADGRQSTLRGLAGIEAVHTPYHQTAIVCTVAHEKPHQNTAQEKFMPAGPFAILPLTDAEDGTHRSSIVWTEKEAYAAHFTALQEDAFNAELQRRFGAYLGRVWVQGARYCYPLALTHATQMTSERMVLVGDAAHAIHPIAGQGANLGLRDVEGLVDTLRMALWCGQDIGHAAGLQEYAKQRQFDIQAMVHTTDSLNRLFANHHAPVVAMRRVGLAAIQQLPAIRTTLMRHAMGVLFSPVGGVR